MKPDKKHGEPNKGSTTTLTTHLNSPRLCSYYNLNLKNHHTPLQKAFATKMRINPTSSAEINAGEAPPVDESLFFDTEDLRRLVKIDNQAFINTVYSAFNPHERKLLLDMEKGIIQESPDGKLFPDCSEKFRHMAFLWACFRNLSHLLSKFEKSGVNPQWVAPRTGINAVSAACLTDSVSCLDYLIKRGVDINHVNPKSHRTCLHAAAIGNSRESAELILNYGANLHLPTNEFVEPILHCAIRNQSDSVAELFIQRGADVTQRNDHGETPLHLACYVQSIYCAEMLLNKSKTDVNSLDKKQRTPLHFAVMNTVSTVELVELLLLNGASINVPDDSGLTALHIAALNEHSHCVESLIWAGADLSASTNKGVSALYIILKKTPNSFKVFRRRLDASIILKHPSRKNREFEMRLELNLLFPSNNQCETSYINVFVQENQTDILLHPLIKAFLHLKWEKIKKFYIWRVFLYVFSIISMTTYVMTAFAYNCYNAFERKNNTICTSNDISGIFFRKSMIEIEWYTSFCLICVLMLSKVMGLTISRTAKLYFYGIENFLDIVVFICNLIISFKYTGKTYDWQKYVGIFAVLCAWTNLMFMFGHLPFFGTYITMFTHIQAEFAKLMLAYSGLLIGFMTSFCVFFISEGYFNNPLTGFIKVLSMMAGDLDFGSVTPHFKMSKNKSFDLYNPVSFFSQLLFCLFVIFVIIILMNLLVGIAVHNIQGLLTQADITKLVGQTKHTLFTELKLNNEKIPHFIRKWIPTHKIDFENGAGVLTVRPLNPLEKRLPKDILTAAYEIAQKNSELASEDENSVSLKFSCLREQNELKPNLSIEAVIKKLTLQLKASGDEFRLLGNKLCDIENILMKIYCKSVNEKIN